MSFVKTGVISMPFTKENFKKASKYNYVTVNDEIYWGVKKYKDRLLIPRDEIKFRQIFGDVKVIDKTIAPNTKRQISLTSLKLLPNQQETAHKVTGAWEKEVTDIVLNAETGFGKSYIVPYFISKLQLKTTIVVDKTMLASQMYNEIRKNSDADVQIVDKSYTYSDVSIVTYQFLIKNPDILEALVEQTGFLIMDEVHIAAANSLTFVTSKFKARYRLGLSATPTRSDGLTNVIYDLFGRYIVTGVNPNTLKVAVHCVQVYDYFYSGGSEYKKKLNSFLLSHYNTIEDIVTGLLNKGRKVCIVVDIHKTQNTLKDRLEEKGISCQILNSKTSKLNREKILNDFNDEKIDVLIGFSVLEKGISIPRLDTILHLSGAGTKEKVVQLIGRLKRVDERKRHPLFVDLCFLGNLERQQSIRGRTYSTLSNVKVSSLPIDIYLSKLKENK